MKLRNIMLSVTAAVCSSAVARMWGMTLIRLHQNQDIPCC